MTSEAKIAANRRNAQRSTGPRTMTGKMRVRRNALRHGLAAAVVRDAGVTAEVQRIAAGICSGADPLEREQALVVAEAQVALRKIRRTRAQIVEQLSHLSQLRPRHASDALPAWLTDPNAPSLDQLLRLERYERHACRGASGRSASPCCEELRTLLKVGGDSMQPDVSGRPVWQIKAKNTTHFNEPQTGGPLKRADLQVRLGGGICVAVPSGGRFAKKILALRGRQKRRQRRTPSRSVSVGRG